MALGTLLLTVPNSGKHITGALGDKVTVNNLQSNELVLCFDKIDTIDIVKKGLGLWEEKKVQNCCDGVIFYAHEQVRVICLVEMKHSDLGKAAKQIKRVKEALYQRLQIECQPCKELRDILAKIIWRAYVYRSSSTNIRALEACKENLLQDFTKDNIYVSGNGDITDFLRQGVASGKHNVSHRRKY